MSEAAMACPDCGPVATRRNGRDRQGRQVHQCRSCHRRFTLLSATPFSGYRFPTDTIALAVRRYPRYRLSYADVAELLAERGGCYNLGRRVEALVPSPQPPVVQVRDALTGALLGR